MTAPLRERTSITLASLGGLTRNVYFAHVVRGVGVKRQNAYVKDLTSYQPENVYQVCEIPLKPLVIGPRTYERK